MKTSHTVRASGRISLTRAIGALVAAIAMSLGLVALATPAQADTVLGVEHEDKNFGGWSYILWISPTGFTCSSSTSGWEWGWASLPGSRNDEISSFRTFAGCRAKHFQNSNYGGVSTPWQTTQSYIGDVMNDRTSSIQFT